MIPFSMNFRDSPTPSAVAVRSSIVSLLADRSLFGNSLGLVGSGPENTVVHPKIMTFALNASCICRTCPVTPGRFIFVPSPELSPDWSLWIGWYNRPACPIPFASRVEVSMELTNYFLLLSSLLVLSINAKYSCFTVRVWLF